MLTPGLAATLIAICDCYRGELPPHLVSALHDISNADDLPGGLRRGATWLLQRRA